MADSPGLSAQAYPATALRVVSGANQGDLIDGADAVELGDVYRLSGDIGPRRLTLNQSRNDGLQTVGIRSEIGEPGETVLLAGALTVMAADGDLVEVLVLRLARTGTLAVPLSPLLARTDYTLIAARDDPGDLKIADIICVAFAAGTLITLPGGQQTPINDLEAGDLVLTRDHGPQPVRWIGKATLRANGAFAPVVIEAGVLGNSNDLVVSPHHRVFVYQRGTRRIGATAELLIQAKHLIDGTSVRRREGGFVDYLSLVFDHHEIIYAEGIPAESLMVNETTLTVLPEAIAEDLRAQFPGLRHSPHYGSEIDRRMVEETGRDALFQRPRKP